MAKTTTFLGSTYDVTPEERARVFARLRKKYPQMFKETAGTPPGRKGGFGLGRRLLQWTAEKRKKTEPQQTTRIKDITNRLKQAGLTETEIAKLRGKKK